MAAQQYRSKDSWLLSLMTRITALWALFTGIAILVGGSIRWAGPLYDTVNYMPGSPQTWAVWLMVAGLLAFVGSYYRMWMRKLGLHLVTLWCMIMAMGIIMTLDSPIVSYNTPLMYIFIGLVSVILSVRK